jgi:phosphate transport system protein
VIRLNAWIPTKLSDVLRVRYEAKVHALAARLCLMGTHVSAMVRDAMQALQDRDDAQALSVIARDNTADDMDLAIEEDCIHLIWSQQPVAADLRVIGTALKAITDLERIGDHAVDIAKIARELNDSVPAPPATDLPRLAEASLRVLDEAIRAFASRSMELVERAITGDDEVDGLYARALADLDGATVRDPAHAVQYNRLSLVALYLERIADHAVNIAERVAYLLTGDYKHLAHSHVTDSTLKIS